ncbi:MAG: hypothetical protein IT373_15140, partial [Polyangiaceae bacterium]|nr:hypothetical protein [Polyangiaceae bacterium]
GEIRDLAFDARGALGLAASAGVWRGEPRAPTARGELEHLGAATPLPVPTDAPSALTTSGVAAGYTVERLSLALPGGGTLGAARELRAAPDGSLWLHDGTRAYRYAADKLEPLVAPPAPTPARQGAPERQLPCHACLAPTGADAGFALGLAAGAPSELTGRARADGPLALEAPAAVAASGAGEAWVVGTGLDDAWPRVLRKHAGAWSYLTGPPLGSFVAVAVHGAEAWLAGGHNATSDGTRDWPNGAGLLCHFDGRAFTTHTEPHGALLAVAAAGPGAAWAVGAAGLVLHVDGTRIERLAVPGAPWLRAVWVGGPNDVWLGGDESTLLHWDGTAWRHVDGAALGVRVAVTSLAPGPNGGIWAAGPAGLWHVKR